MMLIAVLLACGDKDPDSGADTAVDTSPPVDTTPPDSGDPDDRDGDGHSSETDCDDDNASVYPGAPEQCNGVDDDCDGQGEDDSDGDGSPDCRNCDNAGYWNSIKEIKDESSLIGALSTLYKEDACKVYSTAREYLFLTLDNQDGSVEGLYTGEVFKIGDSLPDWDVVNTEHVWPRSAGAEYEPQECDLHHLFPADATANTRRSSLPFGEVATASWSELSLIHI